MNRTVNRMTVGRSLLAALLALVVGLSLAGGMPRDARAEDGGSLEVGMTDSLSPADEQAVSKASVTYRVKVKNTLQAWKGAGVTAGTTGKKQLKSLEVSLSGLEAGLGSVQYQVHGQKAGWYAAVADGAGTQVKSKDYIDAVRIALTGKASQYYDVTYRVYLSGSGWLGWVKNGAVAGKASKKKPVRAVQVKLERKATPEASEGKGIVSARYSAKLQASGWTATSADGATAGKAKKNKRMKSFKIAIDTGAYTGNVLYRTHLTTGKWTKWKRNGAAVGSSKKINAFQVKLTGDIADTYDVVYRAYVSTIGWQRAMRNGESAGVEDGAYRIGAIRVSLVEKANKTGWVKSGKNWSYFKNGAKLKAQWFDSKESPIDPTLKGKHRYWLDSKGRLAVNRFVLPSNAKDAKATYAAFATEAGYINCGKATSPEGVVLSDKKGELYTGTRWLKTSLFDGKTQLYRLEDAGPYALVKTGLFTYDGKKYYGFEDGRGYIMRSKTQWAGDAWYKADASGVLKNVDNQTKQHIKRYVKWAKKIAKNNKHGYSQKNRWGPDYDCSSLVVSALRAAGFPESGALWTGNMKKCLTSIGFVWHTDLSNLKSGDIMLVHNKKHQHTEIYIGNNKLVGAHSSETGGIDGKTGDQTGNEISIRSYYNAPWQGFLRYRG